MSCKFTKPLKEEQINYVLKALEAEKNYNLLAITSLLMKATRVSDVRETITIADVYTMDGKIRDEIVYNEAKTGKKRIIPTKGKLLRVALTEVYKTIEKKDRSCNLFYSRKGKYSNTVISTVTVNRNLKKFVGQCGIEEISSHAIRKTACRLLLDGGVNVAVISKLLNHASQEVTFRYLGINSEDTMEALSLLEF